MAIFITGAQRATQVEDGWLNWLAIITEVSSTQVTQKLDTMMEELSSTATIDLPELAAKPLITQKTQTPVIGLVNTVISNGTPLTTTVSTLL